MGKLLFIPVGILGGVLGRKAFAAVWSRIDDNEMPAPEHRDVPLPRFVGAFALQGAIAGVVRALVDRSARAGVARVTGRWPGERRPDPA